MMFLISVMGTKYAWYPNPGVLHAHGPREGLKRDYE